MNAFSQNKDFPIFNWGDEIPDSIRMVVIHAQDGVYVRGVVRDEEKVILRVIGKTASKEKFPELPDLPASETGVKLFINKMPKEVYQQIVSFFRYAYQAYKSEAAVILYLNSTLNGGTWRADAPVQTVTSAHVQYQQPESIEEGWMLAGTMHSHAAMSAFHSGTDKADEDDTNGFHITFGSKGELDALFVLLGWKFSIKAKDVIELGEPFPEEWKERIVEKFAHKPYTPSYSGSFLSSFIDPFQNYLTENSRWKPADKKDKKKDKDKGKENGGSTHYSGYWETSSDGKRRWKDAKK